jgi:hypothetical protein
MASGIVESTNQDSSQQPQQPGQGRNRLVQRLLGASNDLPRFMHDLLTTMITVVAGTEAAGFVIERKQIPTDAAVAENVDGAEAQPQEGGTDEQGQPQPAEQPALPPTPTLQLLVRPIVHIRDDDSDAETKAMAMRAFQEQVIECIQQNKDEVVEVAQPDAGEPQFCLVTLLRSEGVVLAVAAVITRARDMERARQRLNSMQVIAGYFEVFGLRRHVDQARAIAVSHQNVLQLATAVGTADGFESAAMNLCNELAQRSGARRVSLGWMKGSHIRVRALSHTEKFDKKQELIVQVERTMEECVDQEETVRYDCDGQRSHNVTRAAEQLSRMQGGNSILSFPLRRKDEVLGVLTMEFAPPGKLPDQMVEALAVAADVLTPQLRDRYENDRWLPVKFGHSIQYVTALAIGRKHMLPKVVIVAVLGLVAFITFYKPMYHVSAPFNFTSIGKRPISIPFDGRIEAIGINHRTNKIWMAGDEVKKDDVLASMNVDQLQDELYAAKGEEQAALAAKDAASALLYRDPSKGGEMREAEEKAKSAHAKVELYNLQIGEATMKADTDGVIVRADELDSKRNLRVKEGDILMEIAPSKAFRPELAVSEKDIQDIIEGGKQQVEFAATSFPGDEIIGHIDRVAAPGEAKEGDNVFKVYATIDKGQLRSWIRQGMAGEARVDVGKRRLVWIWTHRLIEFLQLKLWM